MPKAKNGAIKNVMAFPFCIAISKTIIKTTSTSPLEILLVCPSDFSCSRGEVNALQVYPCDLGSAVCTETQSDSILHTQEFICTAKEAVRDGGGFLLSSVKHPVSY